MPDPAEYRIGEWYRIDHAYLSVEKHLNGKVGCCVRFDEQGWPQLQIPGQLQLFVCAVEGGLHNDRIIPVSDIPDDDSDTAPVICDSARVAV